MAIKVTYKPKDDDNIAVKFVCAECGCQFYADKHNMYHCPKDKSLWYSKCPNCNRTVVSDVSPIPWDEVFNALDKLSNWLKEQKENNAKTYYDRFL